MAIPVYNDLDLQGTAKLTGLAAPTVGSDAVNKTYADGLGGGSSLLVENVQSGTTYTPVIGDADKLITMTNAANPVLTMPLNASVNFPVGQQIATRYTGSGVAKFQTTGAATLNGVAAGSFTLAKNQEAIWFQQAIGVWQVTVPRPIIGLTIALQRGAFTL